MLKCDELSRRKPAGDVLRDERVARERAWVLLRELGSVFNRPVMILCATSALLERLGASKNASERLQPAGDDVLRNERIARAAGDHLRFFARRAHC